MRCAPTHSPKQARCGTLCLTRHSCFVFQFTGAKKDHTVVWQMFQPKSSGKKSEYYIDVTMTSKTYG